MSLFDFIYVDRQKVSSLYSQLTGGVVEVRETSNEAGRDSDNKRGYDFKVFTHNAGGVDRERSTERSTIKPHHALIVELEEELRSQGYLLDMVANEDDRSLSNSKVREKLKTTLCVKLKGRAVIEDYERMRGLTEVFPKVAEFINKSIHQSIKASVEYRELEELLLEKKSELKAVKDARARAAMELEIKAGRQKIESLLKQASVGDVEPWVLDGFRTWVDAFVPGIMTFRLYPQGHAPDEHVFGHLKRSGLEDMDSHALHFTYGSLPTEELTLLGVVTSVPQQDQETFRPLAEFDLQQLKDVDSVESGFRGLFRGFDGLEEHIRTLRYPRVMVQPLVVYREVQPAHSAAKRN